METEYKIENICHSRQNQKSLVKRLFKIQSKIPEFKSPYPSLEYEKRLGSRGDPGRLILVASINEEDVGYLVSYDYGHAPYNNESLYLWMAGIVPTHRDKGLMSFMLDLTEWWANISSYRSLLCKSYPEFKQMRRLLYEKSFKSSPQNLFKKRLLENYQPFEKTDIYKNNSNKFSFNFSWSVNKIEQDVVEKSKNHNAMKNLSEGWNSYYFKSGRKFDVIDSNFFRFSPLEKVEYALNHKGELAYYNHPGCPRYFTKAGIPSPEIPSNSPLRKSKF